MRAALDFTRSVVQLVRADLAKLSRYWVVLAGFAAIALISVPGAALVHLAERTVRVTSSSGYDFAFSLMTRLVDLTGPILFVLICIVFAIDVANSTVKYILTRPVTRMELLISKCATALVLVGITVALLWAAALGSGAWYYGLGDLEENGYVIFRAATVWRHILVATGFLLVGYLAIASLGVLVSTWSSTMGGAVIVGLIAYLFFQTLALVPASVGIPIRVGEEEVLFSLGTLGFPSQLYVPLYPLADLATGIPIDRWWTWEIQRYTLTSLGFTAVFFAAAAWRVRHRDFVL